MKKAPIVFLTALIVAATSLYAVSLERFKQTYPSWRYVLYEFDLDPSFLEEDRYFLSFAARNTRKLNKLYTRALRRHPDTVTMIQRTLLQEDMSDLFLYMSIIESGLETHAVSPKKAVGIWQFMPATARRYDLACSSYEDRRTDPKAATEAAVAYLYDLYQRFGKWYLAVLAYNCGEGRLAKAIKKARSDDAALLLDENARYLPAETRHYLRKVLLLAMLAEKDIDMAPVYDIPATSNDGNITHPCPVMLLRSLTLTCDTSWQSLAHDHNITTETLRCLNPEIARAPRLLKGMVLFVPYRGLKDLSASEAKRK